MSRMLSSYDSRYLPPPLPPPKPSPPSLSTPYVSPYANPCERAASAPHPPQPQIGKDMAKAGGRPTPRRMAHTPAAASERRPSEPEVSAEVSPWGEWA